MDSILPPRLNKYPARPIIIDGADARITLTQGYEAVIDAADVCLVQGHNWSACLRRGGRVDATTSVKRDGLSLTFYLNRVICGVTEAVLVDHRDGDTMNNRKGNLRIATNSQNTANRHAPTESNSGYKGVWFDRKRQLYVASIGIRGTRKTIGRFEEAQEAALAYDAAAINAFGEFARTNADLGRYSNG